LLSEGNHGCANVHYKQRGSGADWLARVLRAEGGEGRCAAVNARVAWLAGPVVSRPGG
jgi:hypothetical protein